MACSCLLHYFLKYYLFKNLPNSRIARFQWSMNIFNPTFNSRLVVHLRGDVKKNTKAIFSQNIDFHIFFFLSFSCLRIVSSESCGWRTVVPFHPASRTSQSFVCFVSAFFLPVSSMVFLGAPEIHRSRPQCGKAYGGCFSSLRTSCGHGV